MEAIMKKDNWLASAGLIYVAAWVIGLLIESSPSSTSASTAELTTYFATHQYAHMIQSYLIDGIAGIAILIFAASVTDVFRKHDGENTALSGIVFGAGIAAASVSLV
jgi:hypothetical protein